MKADIKNKILEAAKNLFNERGFHDVSLADIADALNISKGNVTYHFKKKEEIVEAILNAVPDDPFPKTPATISELNDYFLYIQFVVQQNSFYFWHYTQLAQLSPEIQKKQRIIYQNNANKLTRTIILLQESAILQMEEFPGQYAFLIDTLLLTNIYWLPFCKLRQELTKEADFHKQAWSVIFPMLTELGKRELRAAVFDL